MKMIACKSLFTVSLSAYLRLIFRTALLDFSRIASGYAQKICLAAQKTSRKYAKTRQ
jgi:hypothetical protein